MTSKQKDLTKNFFALGIMFWLYERSMEPDAPLGGQQVRGQARLGGGQQAGAQGGLRLRRDDRDLPPPALPGEAGPPGPGHVSQHHRQRGRGAGLRDRIASWPGAACSTARIPSRPRATSSTSSRRTRTSASRTFQAEDEIAAIGSAIGASYGGAMGMTASSGPGIALKLEAMGLAVMVELPLVVVDVQRAGPSTGMPTKNEQSDLLQVMFGRNGDAPVPVVAPATPGECFDYAIEAWRIALRHMTPVVFLSDAFLASGSEPWRIPEPADLPNISVKALDRPRDLPPLRSRPGHPGPTVGRARHARPGAPHRRPGEGRHHGQHQLRPRQPPPDDPAAGPEGGRHRR